MAYEPTLDDVLNSLYGPEGGLTDEELAQYLPEPYVAPQYTPRERPTGGQAPAPQKIRSVPASSGRVKTAVNQRLSPEARALLDTIAGDESPDYRTIYGGRKVSDLSRHPGIGVPIRSGPNAGKTSSAAGRYQFLGSTWNDQAKKLGLSDFSPESQDLAAWNLAIETYGPSLEDDLRSGDPAKIANVGRALRKIWTSLPGGIEQGAQASSFAKRFYSNLNAESGSPQQNSIEPQQEQSPYDFIPLSDGSSVQVERGMDLASVAEILKNSGVQAEPLRQVTLPDGSYVNAPYDYADEQVFDIVKKNKPEVFDQPATPAPQDAKHGYLASAKSSFESGVGSALRGVGGAGEWLGEKLESPLTREAGAYLTGKGKEWQQMGQEAYQELTPEEAAAMGTEGKFRKYVGEPVAGFAGSALSAIPAMVLRGGAATRIGAFAAQELGGQLERQEAEGKPADVAQAAPYAVASGVVQNSLLGPLKYVSKAFGNPEVTSKIADIAKTQGAEAAKQYAGGLITNVLKEVGINTAEVVGSEVLSNVAERAASRLPLDTPDALAEYQNTAIKSAPGGLLGIPGGMGRHSVQQGVIEETQLAKEQAAQEAQRAQERRAAEKAAAEETQKQAEADAELERQAGIGVTEPTIRGEENAVTPPVEPVTPPVEPVTPPVEPVIPEPTIRAKEQLPPVEPVSGVSPVAPEVGAAEIQGAELPPVEPTPEPTPPAHFSDLLGIASKSGKKTDIPLKKTLEQLDIENPEHQPIIVQALETAIPAAEKGQIQLDVPKAREIINQLKPVEVPSADIQPTPAKVNAGRSPQPQIRQESQGAPIGSEGVRGGRPEIGAAEIPKIQETKAPEVTGLQITDLPDNRFRVSGIDMDVAQATLSEQKIPTGSRTPDGLIFNNKVREKVIGVLEAPKIEPTPEVKLETQKVSQTPQTAETPKAPEIPTIQTTLPPVAEKAPEVTAVAKEGETAVPVEKLPTPAEAWDSLRTPEQPAFDSLSKDTQKLWRDEYKASEGIVDKGVVEELVKGEKLFTKEASVSNPDQGIRPIKVEDYSDVTNTRDLIKRYKEKGTDPELLKLADIINTSPHLGALPVEWVKQGDKPHPEVIDAFNKGAAAMVAWGQKTGPKMYIRADMPQREDVLIHEAVHGVTEAALQRNPQLAAEMQSLAKQIGFALGDTAWNPRGADKQKAVQLRDFWNEAVKGDPGELLAYGLTSPSFREVLSQYGADGKPFNSMYRTEAETNALRKSQEKPARSFREPPPKELTLWDKFVDAVAKLFGLPTKRKGEFKRQLNAYLDKKAAYEQQVKDYNTLRPLQERLDAVFKEALRETSKQGIDFESAVMKEAKGPLVKETEAKSNLQRGMKAATDVIKSGAWTRFETAFVNKDAALREVIKDRPLMTEEGELRADMVGSANAQIFNVISAGITDGIPVYSKAGLVMVQKDAKRNISNITKAIDKLNVKNPRVYVGEIARALRGEELLKEDAEMLQKMETLEEKAKKLKAYAKTQSFAEGKKADTLANRYLAEAKELKNRLGEEGREKLVSPEDIVEAKRRLAEHPEIQPILDNIHGLLNSLVDLWEESGLVSKDVAKEWRSKPSYIPLYMAQDDILNDPSKVVRMMGGGAKSLPNVKALKGGTHAINLLENLQKHYAFMISAAAQNSGRKAAARDLELFGAAKKAGPDTKNAIMFKEDGKQVYYEIFDPMLFDAFQAAAPITNPLLKAAREYTKAFRAVTLVNPLYWYRQLIRDPIHANVVSQTGMVTPIGATISFAKIIAGASPEYAELRRRGVVGAVDSLADPARFKKVYDKGPHLFKKGADWVMHVHEAADAATRVEVYKAAIKEAKKKGMDREQAKDYATMRAREIINFAHQGRSETLQAIRATVPFFSAALNSLDSVARAATGKGLNRREAAEARRLFTSRMLAIASFTTAYTLAMQDDEDYLKSPDAINNWLVPTGNKDEPFIMFSLPFELGFVAKSVPELIVRLNSGTLRPYEAKKLAKEAASATLTPPLPLPQILKPLAEVLINYDFHTGRPIVSPSEARKIPEEQTRGASALSIDIGQKLGLSPILVDHFGKGYMSELWAVTGMFAEKFLPAGQYREERYRGEVPIMAGGAKGIVSRPDRDRDVNMFFELSEGTQRIHDSVTSAQGRGNVDAMERIMADPENKKRFYASDVGRNIGKKMSEINTAIDQIRYDKSLNAKEKQEMIRERRQYYNQLASQGVQWFYSLGVEEP